MEEEIGARRGEVKVEKKENAGRENERIDERRKGKRRVMNNVL